MRETRWHAGLVLLGLIVLMPAWVSQAGADELRVNVPEVSGSKQVGTRSFQLVDRSRSAGFDQSGKRRLMVQVYYPLADRSQTRCRQAPYMASATERSLLGFIAIDRPVTVDTGVCAGGKVRGRALPLLVFSHAYTASRGVYSSLLFDLASRGFMVASVDHTYDSFNVAFPGGKSVDGLFGSPLSSKPITEPELVSLVQMRVRDLRFVTTRLLRESSRKRSWLGGRIDRGRIGVFGHSLGGATAARVATVDRRFRSSADVDGSLFGEWPLTVRTHKPFLLLVAEGGLGQVLPQDKACDFFAGATGPKMAWQLDGAKHLSFSDFQSLAPQLAESYPEWPFASLYPAIIGDLEPAASIRSQREGIARFFRATLKPAPGVGERPDPPSGITPASGGQLTCR